MTVGERIRQARESQDMSQSDLANKMGITRQAVSKAEAHDDSITTVKLRKYAEALNVSIEYLMGWDEGEEDNKNNVPVFEEEHLRLIELYSRLPEGQKKVIIDVLECLTKDCEC